MKSYEKYFTERLYPFQDGVLRLVNALETPFYLTGGTALSRHYFNHRYSDDLDFFVNHDDRYPSYVKRIFDRMETESRKGAYAIEHQKTIREENHTQLFLRKENILLKLDFINDVAPHFGEFEESPAFGRIDSWRNMLSNKLSALGRLEIKDFVDLWVVAKHRKFRWRDIFDEAKQKDAGLDPVLIYELLRTVPVESLDLIKWVRPVDPDRFIDELGIIAEDLVFGRKNGLKE